MKINLPFSRKNREKLFINLALILVIAFAMIPIATTVLVSFKKNKTSLANRLSSSRVTPRPRVLIYRPAAGQSKGMSVC